MPITDPFDVIRSRGSQSSTAVDDESDGGSSPLPQEKDDIQTPFSMALQQQRQQAPADLAYQQQQQAKQDAANQKAQEAQAKIDQQNTEEQAKADSANRKADGVVTTDQSFVGPSGKAYTEQMPTANPDGTTAYKPADLGIQTTDDGTPFSVSRNKWGAQQWDNPYGPANANLKLNPTGQIMATPKGKGAAALPQKDVTMQGVTGLDAVDAQGNPDPTQLKVAPDAPIKQPQVQPEIDAEEQKLVKAAAAQRVKDTVGKDADDAQQALNDATTDHLDAVDAAKMAAAAKDNPLAHGYDPIQAANNLQAAQQDAIAKAQAKNDARRNFAAKDAEHKKALLDPVAYVQNESNTDTSDPQSQQQPPATPSPSGTAQPSASSSPQSTPTPDWPATLPAEWQNMTSAQLGKLNPPHGQENAWAQAMQLKVSQEVSAQGVQPSPNPPVTGATTDPSQSTGATPTDPNSITGLITGTYGQQPGSQPTVDAQGNPAPTGPAQKGTWGSWLSNVKTKSLALFGSSIGDIMKGVGDVTDLEAAPEKFLENHVTAPLAKSFMSPANYQKYLDRINAPNLITAAGDQIKANADALASGGVGLQLPNLGPLKGPTLQVDPNRKDLGTSVISGAAGMIPMVAGGEFETPLWMNSGYQNAVDEAKKNGDSPLVTQAKGIVGAVTMGGVSKLFSAFGAPASKFFNPVLWGGREAADSTTNPILQVLQGGAKATTANILGQIAKLAGKGGIEGAGFSVGGQVASGDNPYSPSDAAKNTSDDLSSAGSLAALQAVLGTFTHGKTLHQISKGVDDLVSQTNDARTNPPAGQPPQPPLDRATVLAGLIHQNQVARAQDSFSNLQKQYGALDSNDSLTPQQRLGEKMKALGQVPSELRSAVVAHLDAAADAQRQTDEAMKAADAEQAKFPPTTPELGRRPDAYIQANQQDILQSQQTGQPRQRQLIGNETDADILAEATRRQKLADLATQRSQVVAGIAGSLKDSLDQTVSLAGTPEGRSALLSLNRYNASQPTGTPKASATTLQNAMDLAPRPAGDLSLPSVYVEHYLPLAHQIEQLGNPDQKVMATAATKLTNGRALTDDERTLLLGAPDGSQPAAVTPEGQPFAKVEGQRPILTDAGLARLKTLVPAASEVLPRSEQTQLEAQPPPLPKSGKAPAQPPPLNNSVAPQLSGVDLSKPDPALSKVDDETLQVQHGNVTAAIAKARANGGDSPPTVYAHRDRLATEMARRAAAIQPAESNPLGAPAGAKEGDEIDYTRPTREGQTVQTRGEVTHVGPDHYRVVDAHDGVERTVPIQARPAPVETKQPSGETKAVPDGTNAPKPETTNPRLASAIEASMAGRRMELTDNLRQQKLSIYTGDSSAGNMTIQDAIDQGYLHEFNEDGKIFVRQARLEDKAERPPGQKEKTAQQAEAMGKAQQKQLAHNAVQEHLDGKISRIQLNDRLRNLGMTNDEIEQAVQQHDGTNLPGIDPTTIRPEHRATAGLLSNAFNRFQRLLTNLGLARFKAVKAPDGTIGLGVDPNDLNHIVLDLPRLADNLDQLPTPAARQARVDKVIREEIIHKTGREILGKNADSTYTRIWRQMSPEKQEATLRTYDNGAILPDDPNYQAKKGSGFLRGASEAQKGEEAFRQMVDLYLDGNVTELAGRVTPESRGLLQRIQDYLKKILTPGDRETANLVKTVGDLIKLHDDHLGGEDNLDMSPPKDEPSPSPNGNGRHPADIAMSNGETLPARYELAELGSLSPSHRNGSPNPDYPHGLNERDYSLPEEKQKNEAMANGFDPRRVVTDNPDAVNGPPIVDKNGLVLGGNRRTILLSDPRAYAKYRPYLQANADRFGLKPDDVARMQQPVLVRRVDTPEEQRPELIRRLNEVPTGGIDTANDAVSAGKQITPDLVKSVSDLFQQDPDKTPLQHLSDGDTKSIAQGLLDAGAIRPNDKEKYVASNGNLTPEGARFARSVLLGGVLPDAQLLREISDTPTETKLLNGLSPLYTMKARGAAISPLREAVTLEADRQRLGIKNVAEHQAQGNLAGIGQEATAQGKTLQSFLAGIKGNEARRAFTQLQNLISPLEPGQTGLFGEKNRKSIADVTDAEMNQVIKSSKRITKAADKLRAVVGGGEVAEKPVSYPGPLPMPGMPPGELSPEQRAVEARFAKWVQEDPDRAARAYAALPQTEGGRVIDMDEARKLSPDYNASKRAKTLNSVSVQKVVNALAIKKMLGDALASLEPGDTMGLTAGGPGSGKGNIKHVLPAEWTGAKFVYDGVLRNFHDADFFINQAKAHGAKTQLWYVHVPVEKAVDQAVGRAEHDGRALPIKVLATGHFQAQETAIALLKKYEHDPAVNIKVVDNSGPQARVVENPLSFLQNERILYRDADEVEQRARQAFEGSSRRLSDPDAVSIFWSGKTSQASSLPRVGSGPESGLGQREPGLESDHDRSAPARDASRTSPGTDRPVSGAAVGDDQTGNLFDEAPKAEVPESKQGALKAYKTLTALKAGGTKLSVAQEQTLEKAERALGQQFIPGTVDTPAPIDRQKAERDALHNALSPRVDAAYNGIKQEQGGLSAVSIGKLAERSGLRMDVLHKHLLESARRGEADLHPTSSLQLSPEDRAGAMDIGRGPNEPAITTTIRRATAAPKTLPVTKPRQQSMFDTGKDVQRGQSLLFGGAITSDEPTGYEKVPDSLMGYAKSEDRNKSFEDSNYPHGYNVKVDFKDGSAPFEDGMRGMNPKHALERAKRNWDGAHITLDASTPIFGGAVADHPDVEKPLARYVAALRQGELNLDKPVDFSREFHTDMGRPAPTTLIDRAKELEAQPGQDEGATPELRFSNHLDMADRLASAYHNIPGIEPDDARQVARTALATAADGYDPSRGVPFRGYASAVIRNGLRDLYRYQARRAVEQPTLDAPVSRDKEGMEATGKDYVQSSEPTASQQAARNDAHARLRDYIDKVSMPDGSREALRGLLSGKSNVEIAQEQGVTPQRISAAVGHGLEKLRAALAEKKLSRGDFLGGGAIPAEHLKPDFGDSNFTELKENLDPEDPETWPIHGDEAEAIKERTGDVEDYDEGNALDSAIEDMTNNGWPQAVIDKAQQARDAMQKHLDERTAAIKEQGNAWKQWFKNPDREIAYTKPDVDDPDTWPPKAQKAWDKVNTGDPKTWPKGLEEDARKAGELTEYDDADPDEPGDEPTPPDVDEDFARGWFHEHMAEPEWLQHVDRLPEANDILRKAAQTERDGEIRAEVNRRMDAAGMGDHIQKTYAPVHALNQELKSKYGLPHDRYLMRDKDGRPVLKNFSDPDHVLTEDEAQRADPLLKAYEKGRADSDTMENQLLPQVEQEMSGKPLRDFRKPSPETSEQGTLFGAGVKDAPTDTNHSPKDGFAIENYREPDPAHEKHLLDELPSADRARAQIAEKFLGIPIKASIDRIPLDSDIQKGAELLHNVKDQALKVLAPQVRTDQAGLAGELYSHRAAEYRLMRTQAIEAVKSARAMIDRKGKNALDFTLSIARAIESDTPHPDPEARAIVDLFTAVNNRFRDMVRSLPGTHFRNYIVDYFPHMFAERDQAKAAKFYERKLQGSTAFVKHRSIPTIQEAYEAGLHLKSDNAADLFLMKWDEMLRYKMGQDYLADLKENNLARPFDSDAAAPAGWSQVDSRIGKSTVSVPAHRDTPGAYEVKNNQVPLPGMPAEKKYGVDKAIHYYAPDSVAQVLNNHLAPGLSDYAWYKGSMMLANTLNQANLGFSAFHLGFVTCDSMISKQADAMESLIRDKDPAATVKKLAQAYTPGVAPIMSYLSGNKLMKAALAPGTSENSELNAMIDAVTKGGGDVKRGEIYSNGWVQAMLQNWRKGTATGYAQAGIRFPAALIEAAAHPILGHIVPRVKLGVFMDMARRELRRLGPDASHQATLKALQGAWASVDNRLGEFAYDNLHMHQGAKHVAFLAIRSVGWDLGTARELGLGTLDAARLGKNLVSGKGSADDFTHRLAYTISLPMMLGAYGALATYLATGKAPQDIRDYFFPPTGEIDPYGHKMRFAPPTYGKDVAGFFHQPGQTLVNKLNPIWSNMFSIFQNRDFWGNQIYSPDDPAYKKGAEMLRYEAGAFEPFALSGYLQNRKMGVGVAKSVAPFFGLTPAASWIDKSPAEERAQELENRLHAGEVHSSDEAASYQKYLALRNQFAQNDPLAGATPDEKAKAQKALANPNLAPSDKAAAQNTLAKPDMTPDERLHRQLTNSAALRQAIEDGTIKPSGVAKVVDDARKPPLQRMFDGIVEEFQKKGDSKNAYEQAKSIWDLATPQEQKLLFPKMVNVWATAMTNKLTADPKPVNPAAPKPAPAMAGAGTKN